MAVTSKKSLRANINEVGNVIVNGDTFGAQIIDVIFYNNGNEVIPVSGSYTIEYSPNGKSFLPFEGAFFPQPVLNNIGDVQAGGYIEQIRFTPFDIEGADQYEVKYRVHGIGKPSHVTKTSESTRYYTGLHTINTNDKDFATLNGNTVHTSQLLTIPANTTYSFNLDTVFTAVIDYIEFEGALISYYNGDVSGALLDIISMYSLNLSLPVSMQASLNLYDGAATGTNIYQDVNRIEERSVMGSTGAIQIENNTGADITAYLKVTAQSIGDFSLDNLLTADTLLEADTEMSVYNGTN